jgi:hypothetical protein
MRHAFDGSELLTTAAAAVVARLDGAHASRAGQELHRTCAALFFFPKRSAVMFGWDAVYFRFGGDDNPSVIDVDDALPASVNNGQQCMIRRTSQSLVLLSHSISPMHFRSVLVPCCINKALSSSYKNKLRLKKYHSLSKYLFIPFYMIMIVCHK